MHRLLLSVLLLAIALPAFAGVPAPTPFQGRDSQKFRLSGGPGIGGGSASIDSFRASASLAVDGSFAYETRPGAGATLSFDAEFASLDPPVLSFANADLAPLNAHLETVLEALGFRGLGDVVDVFVLREGITSKVTRKDKKGETTLSLQITFPFEGMNAAQRFFDGRLQLKSQLSSEARCPACGSTYTGVEMRKTGFKGCEGGRSEGAGTLVIDPVAHDQGLSDFTYTDADGRVLTGFVSQSGKRLECGFDPEVSDVWTARAADACGETPSAVTLPKRKCAGKLGSDGALRWSMSLSGEGSGASDSIRGGTSTRADLTPTP